MAKDKRTRGQIRRGVRYDEYDQIDTVNNGTIKVIKSKPEISNNGVPIFSNSMNTTYMLAKDVDGKEQITSIALYRNGKIIQNIDLNEKQGLHYHDWIEMKKKGKEKRKKLSKHNPNLNRKQKKLVKLAKEWNDKK